MGEDNDSAEEILQKFAAQHAHKFGPDFLESDDFENKLEYTLVYQEYQKLLESQIERLIKDCDVTVEDFFQALKKQKDQDPQAKFYIDMLLGCADYQNFLMLMRQFIIEGINNEEEE